MNLKLIEGVAKTKPDLFALYENAFINTLKRIIGANTTIDKIDLIERERAVFYGIKMYAHSETEGKNYDQLMHAFNGMEFIKAVVSTLTPNEFETIFPIDKEYNGERYLSKDYFYTKKTMKEMGEEEEIGDKVNDLFWDYQNINVSLFYVNLMSIVSGIRRAEGQKGMLEEFCEENGLTTYTMYNDEKGKRYLQNNQTGEVSRVRKAKPRYLNVVK